MNDRYENQTTLGSNSPLMTMIWIGVSLMLVLGCATAAFAQASH